MRILIISAVFPPERVMSAFTARDLADELSKRGHEIVVLAPFPNRPSGRVFNGYRRTLFTREHREAYKVLHSWHSLSRKSTFVSRGLENLTFGLSSTAALAFMKKPDVVYMNTWPVLSQNLNGFVLFPKSVPIVCTVQDLYPESLTNKGLVKPEGVFARSLLRMDNHFLRKCRTVTTLSDGMRDTLIHERKLPEDKVRTVNNWLDADRFPPHLPVNAEFRQKQGIDRDCFVAMFAGSLTTSAGVETYIKIAELLREDNRIHLVLAGDGSRREWIESEIVRKRLKNLKVIHPLIPEDVPEVQSGADVLLLSLTGKTTQNAVPSKLIAYMFSARPVLASLSENSAPAELIRSSGGGIVLPPDDPYAVSAQLKSWAQDRRGLTEMGKRARAHAMKAFSKKTLLPKMISIIEHADKR